MMENGEIKAAAPECKGQLGWVYHNGACYMFTSYHADYLEAEECCNEVGGYLADILTLPIMKPTFLQIHSQLDRCFTTSTYVFSTI